MNKRIVFRHMEHSAVLEEYANKQLAKIETFLEHEREPIFIDLILEPSKVHKHHKVELRVKTPQYDLISTYEHEGDEFYKTLDRVIDTMYEQIREKKKFLKDKEKSVGRSDEFKKQ